MSTSPSDYLQHLPEIFRTSFLGELLKVFEALLSGRDDAVVDSDVVVSLEEKIERYIEYLDPSRVPVDDSGARVLRSEFLSYLASWVALTLDQNWDMAKKRTWLSQIVPLYKRRGTLVGIRAYLDIFVGNQATVDDSPPFVVGVSATIGDDTMVGAPPYLFRVRLEYAYDGKPFDIDEWKNFRAGARAIVELEKPAHTYYFSDTRTPGIIVGERSTIGKDALIWQRSRRFS